MNILLTNDDGVFAKGLQVLQKVLGSRHSIFVAAPLEQRSGASRSISIRKHLRVEKIGTNVFAVDGTPSDAVIMGLEVFKKQHIDLILSGINAGRNTASDIFYSGTVCAAMEGAEKQIPSWAISCHTKKDDRFYYTDAAVFCEKLISMKEYIKLPPEIVLNINYPALSTAELKGVKIVKHGNNVSHRIVTEEKQERKFYKIDGLHDEGHNQPDTKAILDGYIAITPIKADINVENGCELLQQQIGNMF